MRYYYANCRAGGKTCLLAGPFPTEAKALHALETVAPIAIELMPSLKGATFGSMSVTKNIGPGQYNEALANPKTML